MDLSVLVGFFTHQALLLNPVSSLVFFFARITYSICKGLDFHPDRVLRVLGNTARKVRGETIKVLCQQAQKGIDHLTEWMAGKMNDLDVNEATTTILASQIDEIGQMFDQSEVEQTKREKIAKHLEEGMEKVGGAAQAIAEPFSQAMTQPEKRKELSEAMQQKLENYYRLSIVARKNSLIKDVEQIVEGNPAGKIDQEIRAEDDSKIIGASQTVRTQYRKPRKK